MKKDLKDLLLIDLCARLPYKVKASYYGAEEEMQMYDEVEGVCGDYVEIGQYSLPIEAVKPYLFPLSSMTEEQREELVSKHLGYYQVFDGIGRRFFFEKGYEIYDWFNKNHFDYRGLIEKSFAIDATNLGIYK